MEINEEMFWKMFQDHWGYTDEELKMFKSDPHRARAGQKMFSPELEKKFLIIEVVDSHGCAVGMKPGDRLYFRGMAVLDAGKSTVPWCVQAFSYLPAISSMCHDRWMEGLDPNGMIYNRFSCPDCGVRSGGWGRATMKAYVKDESEL